MAMNPEVKALWLNALRSGEYKQAQGALKVTTRYVGEVETDSFCCLGVLTDLAVKAGIMKEGEEEPGMRSDSWTRKFAAYFTASDDVCDPAYGEGSGLHPAVQAWSGLASNVGILPHHLGSYKSLVALNDGAQYTFEEIANVIEEQF